MLMLDRELPPGALIGHEAALLDDALRPAGALWFSARAAQLTQAEDGHVTGWRSQDGRGLALPTKPNTGNCNFDASPPGAMLFRTGTHCGFGLRHAATSAARFSLAVIYSAPQDDPRTLVAVNTGRANNTIFLTEAEGILSARDRGNTLAAELPVPRRDAAARLAVFGFTGRELVLRAFGRESRTAGRPDAMDQPADLFIGCRSDRSGLGKTLGGARLHDVIFWPDRMLLGSGSAEDSTTLDTLSRYHRWTY